MQRLVVETLDALPPVSFLDRMSDFVFHCSNDASKLHYINPHAAEFFGWSQAEILKFNPWWEQLFGQGSTAECERVLETIRAVEEKKSDVAPPELSCLNVGGGEVTLEVHTAYRIPKGMLILASGSLSADAAEEIIRQTQARFRSIVDGLSINLVLKDKAGRRVYANRAYLDLRKLELADIIGKTDSDLFPRDLAEQFTQDDRQVMRTGKVIHKFEENVDSDGKRSWTEIVKGPLRDADDLVSGVQILFWDATQRKETELALERERYLLHSLLDNVPDSIYFKDRESRFVRISGGMAKKFNLPDPMSAIGKDDGDIFTEVHAQQARADELRIMETGEPVINLVERETWPDRPDSWCSSTKLPLYDADGNVIGTFGISRDITDLVEVEQQLREARDQADKASNAKSEFLANMSHEIRTPMNGILGMAELLAHTPLSEAQRSFLEMIEQSAVSLLRIINDILDFSKIEAGKLDVVVAPFDVRKVIGQAAKGLSIRATRKSVELLLEIAPEVPERFVGDADRLRQVLVNLVGNAIKFTDQGTITVRAEVTSGPPSEDIYTLHFSVTDTGTGIRPEKQRAIFEAFAQADVSTTREYGGTGLGLSISSRLVEMMGGKIWLESEFGVGSTFHFTCQMEEDTASRSLSQTAPAVPTQTPILLVDHHHASRQQLARELQQLGLEVHEATDAAEARRMHGQICQQQKQQVVVVEQTLSDVDGASLIDLMRHDATDSKTIAILLASAPELSTDIAFTHQPGLIVLHKPVLAREILQAVQSARTDSPLAVVDKPDVEFKPPTPLNLLVAEDGEVNRAVLVGLLEREGHSVSVAVDGVEAVEAWEEFEYDAILMDVQMPNRDGLEATRIIRTVEASQPDPRTATPIIAITAAALERDQTACFEAGMDDYLSKPIQVEQLKELLSRLVQHKLREDLTKPFPQALSKATETQSTAPASSPQQSINFQAPLKKLNCSPAQHVQLVHTFENETHQRLAELDESIGNQDVKLLIRAAHSLASATAMFDATEVSSAASQLERAARSGDLLAATQLYDSVRTMTNDMLAEIERWLAQQK